MENSDRRPKTPRSQRVCPAGGGNRRRRVCRKANGSDERNDWHIFILLCSRPFRLWFGRKTTSLFDAAGLPGGYLRSPLHKAAHRHVAPRSPATATPSLVNGERTMGAHHVCGNERDTPPHPEGTRPVASNIPNAEVIFRPILYHLTSRLLTTDERAFTIAYALRSHRMEHAPMKNRNEKR